MELISFIYYLYNTYSMLIIAFSYCNWCCKMDDHCGAINAVSP